MWARISEIILGLWLLISHFLLFTKEERFTTIFASAICVLLFSFLCFHRKFSLMHLMNIFPIGVLFWISFSYPTPFLPMALQNVLIVGILLLIFSVVPSRASLEPKSWRAYLIQR